MKLCRPKFARFHRLRQAWQKYASGTEERQQIPKFTAHANHQSFACFCNNAIAQRSAQSAVFLLRQEIAKRPGQSPEDVVVPALRGNKQCRRGMYYVCTRKHKPAGPLLTTTVWPTRITRCCPSYHRTTTSAIRSAPKFPSDHAYSGPAVLRRMPAKPADCTGSARRIHTGA
jgi:hypothetical protein